MAVIRTQRPSVPVSLSRRLTAVYWPAVLWSALAGGVGGFAGWLPGELVNSPHNPNVYMEVFIYFAVVSAGLGAVLGALPGLLNRSRHQAARGALIGALAGGVGGGVAALPAQWMYMTMGYGVLARAVAWGINGAGIGLCPGAATRDLRRAGRGLVAGLIGGFMAGLLFELVWAITPHVATDTGTSSRFIADIVLGICIGIAVALIEAVARNAWLTVLSGRREGAQFIISKQKTSIGRDDRDDVLLWGDGQLALHHATITRTPRGYLLEPLSREAPTQVNQQLTRGSAVLHDGDEVMLGATRLLFRTHSPVAPSSGNHTSPPPPAGLSPAPPQSAPAPREWQPSPVRPATLEEGMAFQLVGMSPVDGRYPLHVDSPVSIGRDPRNSIVLSDETVSAHHAQLRWEEGHWVVYDLDSTNGTCASFSGTREAERPVSGRNALRAGSTVRFGNIALRLEQCAGPSAGDA